jgi:hypothetical protein
MKEQCGKGRLGKQYAYILQRLKKNQVFNINHSFPKLIIQY